MKDKILMRVYLEKKFLLAYRCLMIVVALYFLWPIYGVLDNGYVIVKGSKRLIGDLSFYSYIVKQVFISLLFIWLGTAGAREKKADGDK